MIDMKKKYRYHDGGAARILCVDRPGECPVVSMTGLGTIYTHLEDGNGKFGQAVISIVASNGLGARSNSDSFPRQRQRFQSEQSILVVIALALVRFSRSSVCFSSPTCTQVANSYSILGTMCLSL